MAEDEPEEEGGGNGIRSFWSGSITFGLVSVPVSLFPATKPRGIALRMVDSEGATLERKYVCSKDGKDLDWDDIVRGYEIEKGKFVVVTDDELEAIEPRKSREIDLRLFVDREAIDPVYFERAYFLVPAAGSNKAYRLLAAVMEKNDKAGIATFVMRAREYLIAILAENGVLRAETLRFADEIRKPDDVGLPEVHEPKPAAVRRFEAEISSHSGKVDFAEFLDEYAERLRKLAEKKRKQGAEVIEARGPEEGEKGGEVVDLLEVLSRSMRSPDATRKAPKSAAREAAARKKAAPKKK